MSRCPSCGGIIGVDCFNTVDCAMISAREQSWNDQATMVALNAAKDTIQWFEDNMPYDESNQSDRFHKYAHAMDLINQQLPQDTTTINEDDLPF